MFPEACSMMHEVLPTVGPPATIAGAKAQAAYLCLMPQLWAQQRSSHCMLEGLA